MNDQRIQQLELQLQASQADNLEARIRQNPLRARKLLVRIEHENRIRQLLPGTFALSEGPGKPG